MYKRRKSRSLFIPMAIAAIVLIVAAIGGTTLYVRDKYQQNLRPVSSSIKQVYFTVEKGDTSRQIGDKLERAGLVRSSSAFQWYVRSQEVRDQIQAGTYIIMPSLSVNQIVQKMTSGDVAKNLLTILPGKRLDQIKQAFSDAGYSKSSIENAFNPANYRTKAALAGLPPTASLEGYLYPDSYEKLADTSAITIVGDSLDEMSKRLTPSIITGIANQGLTTHQGVILASMIDQEVSNPNDKPIVAQVFLKRLRQGMLLGSDVTAFYASALAGKSPSVFIDSPYNTRVYKGLPPGPIGNVTSQALEAVANPSPTDYLFFVAGDDGTVYYSNTQAEHDALTKKYCTKLCN